MIEDPSIIVLQLIYTSVFWFISSFLSLSPFLSLSLPFFFLFFISKSTFRASILTIQTEIEWIRFLPSRCVKLNVGLKTIVRIRDLQKQLHGDMSFKRGILCTVCFIQYLKIMLNMKKIIKEHVPFFSWNGRKSRISSSLLILRCRFCRSFWKHMFSFGILLFTNF